MATSGSKGITIQGIRESTSGKNNMGQIQQVQITPDETKCFNPAFDVTPSNLVTGLMTEKGICKANLNSLGELYK